jgi:OmcA/MtrC family decaheme c-type cytochrome
MLNKKYLSIMRLGAVALIAAALTGCGGGSSSTVAPPPVVDSGITVTGFTPLTTDPNAAFSNLKGSVVQSTSPTKVFFTVMDSAGHPVQNLTLSGAAGGNCGSYNVRAAMAVLTPAQTTDGRMDWQNLITRIRPAASNPNGYKEGTTDPVPTAVPNPNLGVGSLTYNAAGYYTYTFGTPVTDPAYSVTDPALGTITTDGHSLNKDGTTTYRVGLQVCFLDSTGKTVYVNPYYDFTMGNTGLSAPVTDPTKTKKVVDRTSCNECHGALNMHGGRRVDPNYCVMCHNRGSVDFNDNDLADLGYPDGGAPLTLTYMVHKFHRGELLTKDYQVVDAIARKDTHVQLSDGSTIIEGTQYPQDQRNCITCHDNSKNPTQGDNWKMVPNRVSCGACHDGINFATGGGYTIDPDVAWHNLGHIGGAQANDTKCVECHTADSISNEYHQPVVAIAGTGSSAGKTTYYPSGVDTTRLPQDAITVSYDIKSVTVNGTGHPVVTFCMKQATPANPTAVCKPFNAYAAGAQLWPNFTGTPSIYLAYSRAQDSIAAPTDFNGYISSSVMNLWDGSKGTLSAPDVDGYYTATFTATLPIAPDPNPASMVTAAMGYGAMYQTNVAGWEATAPVGCAVAPCTYGLNVSAQDVKKVATGYTPRRPTVDTDRCNLCHEKLGIFAESTFHSGQRNDPSMCAMCHNPNRTSSGWSADSSAFVHGIHAGGSEWGDPMRTVPYVWHATTGLLIDGITPARTKDFATIIFPGGKNHLKNCESCHVDGGYDFSGAGAASGAVQSASRLYRAAAGGTMAAAGTAGALSLSPYVTPGATYGSSASINKADGLTFPDQNTLANSPIANACFACHDGDLAASPGTTVKDHIEQMGIGSIYRVRGLPGTLDTTVALGRKEQCLLCHGPTANIAPIKAAHGL